jgi:hypothetical protein
VFTALVGLVIAPGHLDPLLGSIAILAIAAGAGAAGVLNMWHDCRIRRCSSERFIIIRHCLPAPLALAGA